MLKGRLCAAGELNVDGDIMTGVFIEVSREDLRNHVNILYCDVEVRAAKDLGIIDKQTTNNAMDEICRCPDGGAWSILHIIIPGKQVNYCSNCGGKLSPVA
jgi:hypothetical protein